MSKGTKIAIGVIIGLALLLALLIKVVFFNGFSFLSSFNDTVNSSSNNLITLTDEDTGIEIKDGEDEDYDEYTAKIDISILSVEGSGAEIKDNTITITKEGIYYIKGKNEDCNIVINSDKSKIVLILDNVTLSSKTTAPINVIDAKKVVIRLLENTTSTISDSSNYILFTEDDEPNATIFSKADLVISGTGKLVVNANYKDAIASKDTLKIINGNIEIKAVDDGIRGKDCVEILNGSFDINVGGDGIKSSNDEDISLGYVLIKNGTFNINASSDGIQGITKVIISDGIFNIKSEEGIEATYVQIDGGTINIEASDDGINASDKSTICTPTVVINEGEITIKMGQGDTDGIDANGDIYINGGTINITGNSSFDYDGKAEHNGGTIIVNGSEIDTISNQFGGMMQGMQGGMPNGMPGNMQRGMQKEFKNQNK